MLSGMRTSSVGPPTPCSPKDHDLDLMAPGAGLRRVGVSVGEVRQARPPGARAWRRPEAEAERAEVIASEERAHESARRRDEANQESSERPSDSHRSPSASV